MDIIKFSVYENEDKVRVEEQKLQLKGYQVQVVASRDVVVDTRDSEGSVEYFNVPDSNVFVLIAKK